MRSPGVVEVSILIDPPVWAAHGRRWSHLVSDSSLDELHAFARALGIPARAFEGDHYDLPEERYAAVVHAGAIPVTSRELLRRLKASGLRRSKRRGERVLASAVAERGGVRVRLDTLSSPHPPIGAVTVVHLVVRRRHEVLALPDGVGFLLPCTQTEGDTVPEAGRRLIGRVLPAPAPGGEPIALAQLGFVRAVALPEGPATAFEVVLHGTLPPGDDDHGVSGRAEWVSAHDAAALLPLPLAPLLRP